MSYESEGDTLTPKQAKFAQLIAEGVNQSDAYRESYDTNGSDKTIHVEASRLMNNEKIVAVVERLKQGDVREKAINDKLTHQWVLDKLKAEASDKKNSGAVRVRALELLGKYQGMFDDSSTVVVKDRSPDDIRKELEKRLAAALGQKKAPPPTEDDGADDVEHMN